MPTPARTPAKKTTPAKKAPAKKAPAKKAPAAALPAAGPLARPEAPMPPGMLDRFTNHAAAAEQLAAITAEVERRGGARPGESLPVAVARIIDDAERAARAAAVAANTDPASGTAPFTVDTAPTLSLTVNDEFLATFTTTNGRAPTIDDLATQLGVDADALRATNIGVLDAEAIARGLEHSDRGRILFAGTTIQVPRPGG